MELPTGVNFYSGDSARDRRRLEEIQISILTGKGFQEVISPVFEYHAPGEERGPEDRTYKFPDLLTGRMLALRWDFTLQVARFAARRRGEGEVQRWFYRGDVFRTVREHAGQKRQIYQVGAEVFGDPSLESTAGMIDLAVEVLEASEVDRFAVVIGHVGFIEGMIKSLDLPPEHEPAFREVLRRKDLSALDSLARERGLTSDRREGIRRAMYLMGGEEVLEEAAGIFPEMTSLEELSRVCQKTAKARDRIIFDLTEPRGFDYYTGVMFQAVVPSIGREVLMGGCYDDLLGRFGRPSPAVGFALDLDLTAQASSGNFKGEQSG